MKIRIREENTEIESAITFLVEKINEHNTNPKPLILHSLRVGLRLYEKGESKKVVIGGLLHDLQEDTNCTNKDIENKFGVELAQFVDIFDYDDDTIHYTVRWEKSIGRMVKYGRDAAIVKIVDIHDNLHYLPIVVNGKEITKGIFWRHELVRDAFKDLLSEDHDYKEFVLNLKENKKKLRQT